MQYVVSGGERLAGISHLLTGSQENWPELARINGLDNPRSVRAGTVLTIPGHLLKPGKLAQPGKLSPLRTLASSNVKKTQPARVSKDGKILVFQPTAVPGPKKIKVKTAKTSTNREFKLTDRTKTGTITASTNNDPRSLPDNLSDWVLVVGSYYPKGVYVQPDIGSRIMMRVAPGSRLRLNGKVSGEGDEWLKVETDKGTGYIRKSDAEILTAKTNASSLVAKL